MESPARFTETLEHILHFLRTEGFYAAEDALREEIENRFPDSASPLGTATSSPALPSAALALSEDPGAAFSETLPSVPTTPPDTKQLARCLSGLCKATGSLHLAVKRTFPPCVSFRLHASGTAAFPRCDCRSGLDHGRIPFLSGGLSLAWCRCATQDRVISCICHSRACDFVKQIWPA